MPRHIPDAPQQEKKHPDAWERDLNPDRMGGQNIGALSASQNPRTRWADGVKEAFDLLPDFRRDEVAHIPIVPDGDRLQQGATYVDLRDPDRRPFTATAEMRAETEQLLVCKHDVTYTDWNRIVGLSHPERTT